MDYMILVGAIILLIVLVMVKEYISSKNYRRRLSEKIFQNYGVESDRKYRAGEMEHIAMYYHKHPVSHQIDDITWNDLNMDSLYQRMNTSCSAAGDEYLYFRLRTPVYERAEMEQMESRIRFFMEHENERREIQSTFLDLGRTDRYSIYEYLDNLDTLGERRNAQYFFNDLMLLVSIGIIFLSFPIGMIALLGVLCHNIIGYFREYRQIEPYITSFRYINRLLASAEQLGKRQISGIDKEQKRLYECYRKMKGFIRNSYLIVFTEKGNGNPLGILMDYLRMIFYLDLIQFNKALRAVRGHMAEIDEMITLLGEIETAIVIGSYRNSLKEGYCIPTIRYGQDADRHLTIENLYHPMLDSPVKNSILTGKGVLITGSNASGKSTFLRAAAVCAVLAQTIHTCPADRYDAPVLHIYSSISLGDDLLGGQSYYMAEITSVKRILDQIGQAREDRCYVLCLVDEVLRGTNTVERIAASTQIMKAFAVDRAICFAATHDVELTTLLDRQYDNYHFEERIEGSDIFFQYKLMKGPATTRNAIALLKVLGYDSRIIARAEEMAKEFLKSGNWIEPASQHTEIFC